MPVESAILVLVGVAVLAVAAMAVALGAAWLAGQRRAEALYGVPGGDSQMTLRSADPAIPSGTGVGGMAGVTDLLTMDRVVRVVALLFIAAAGVVVAVGGAVTPDPAASATRDAAVFVLLALATLALVFVQDLLPDDLRGRTRLWTEAVGALVFLTLLVGLTGGLMSPFFVGFFLLVAGAALVSEGLGPVALALVASLCYAVVGLVEGVVVSPARDVVNVPVGAWIGFNVASLLLLAYLGMAAGRAHRAARDAALRLSRSDGLTGLHNRSAFFAAVDRELRRAERSGRGFTLLMLDLDDLKPVNDTFGHPAGDQLLRAITEVITRTVRASDLAGRYGGDEFVVLLPETDPEGAIVVAEKLRRDVSALSMRMGDRSIRTSVSIGLVAYPADGRTIEDLLSAVDAAMYEAKRRGKNQIVAYTTRTERVATSLDTDRPERPERPNPAVWPRLGRPGDARSSEVSRPGSNGPSDPGDDDLDAGAPAYPAGGPPGRGPSRPPVAPASTAAPTPRPPAAAPGTRPAPPASPTRTSPTRTSPTPRASTGASAATPRPVVPVPVARVPVRPSDPTIGGLPPVPPPGAAPWQTRGAPTRGTPASDRDEDAEP